MFKCVPVHIGTYLYLTEGSPISFFCFLLPYLLFVFNIVFSLSSESWSQNLQSSASSYQQFESSSVFAPPHFHPSASLVANQFGTIRPAWYDPYSENFRISSQPHLILDIEKADWELHCMINSGKWLENWSRIEYIR